jgi:hypothetical protein
MLEADTHCLSKSPRASCKVDQVRLGAAKPHEVDSLQRFKGAQQDPGAHTGNFAGNIEHAVQSVREIYIGVPPLEKQ